MKSEGREEEADSLDRMQITRSSGNFSKGSDDPFVLLRLILGFFRLTMTVCFLFFSFLLFFRKRETMRGGRKEGFRVAF